MDKTIRIQDLVKQLNEACYAYYVQDKPVMTDKQYDLLYDELTTLENETGYILSSSPTQRVQGQVLESLTKVKHTEPMLSAEKSKDINDIIKFMGNQICILSWKLDGLTIILRYDDGKLQQAITRGGGDFGEDVTHTVKTFSNIPLTIDYKGYLEIRGEGLVTFKDFERINNELITKGEEIYSSPRNLAAGSVRQLDANITKARNLIFIAFGIVKCTNEIFYKDLQFKFLQSLGFNVVEYHMVAKDYLPTVVDLFSEKISTLPYLTDGLIIEFNDITYGKAQGFTGHHNKNIFAMKWEDDSVETTFKGVELNTTRTGMVSITGLFDEVDIDGVKVSRASLHNYDIFEELQLGVGDTISVYRANAVIPQIENNLTRSGTYKIEMKCPSCGSPVVIKRPKEARFLFCENDNCPSKLVNKFVHFCSRNAMNIDGFSEAGIELFINKGFIKTFDDLYRFEQHKDKIVKLEGWGVRSYNNLIEAIEQSKKTELYRLVYGLGIPQVGLSGSKNLCKHFNNDIQKIMKASFGDLLKVKDFGEITAKNVFNYFGSSKGFSEVSSLLKYLVFNQEEKKETTEVEDNPFKGKHVYPTGKFSLKKDELKVKLEDLGAIVESGYKKSLDLLICGGDMSKSGKADKAAKDGVKMVSEEYLIQYLK